MEDLVANLTNEEKISFKNGLLMLYKKLKDEAKSSRGFEAFERPPGNMDMPQSRNLESREGAEQKTKGGTNKNPKI